MAVAIAAGMLCVSVPMTDHLGFLAINLIVMGMFAVPIIPTTFAFAIELSYPMLPATANGLMMLCGQFCAFVMSFIGSWITETQSEDVNDSRYLSLQFIFFLALSSIGAFICTFFIREDLRRYNYQKGITAAEIPEDEIESEHSSSSRKGNGSKSYIN